MSDEFENSVEYRYSVAFPDNPVPMKHWYGDVPELRRLMEKAIKAGKPLTPEALLAAQNMGPSPPDAVV